MCHYVQHCWLVLRTLAGFTLYIADFVTDVILAAEYYRNGDYYWFGLTLGFALVPQIIVNIVLAYLDGCEWYYLPLLPLGVPAKYFQVLHGLFCCKHKPEDILESREKEDQDDQEPVPRAVNHLLPLARLVGTLLESLPELCLQIYVLVRTGQLSSLEIPALKAVTMAVSFLASLYSIIEWETHFPKVVACIWGPLVFLWKIVDLSARILAFCLFASIYNVRYWVFVVIGGHWLVMAGVENYFCLYLVKGKAWMESGADVISDSNCYVQFMFNTFVVAPVDVFTWVTFGSRQRRKEQPIVNNVLMLAANIVMVLAWYFEKNIESWYDDYALVVVFGGSVASVVFQMMYFVCYRPCCACSPIEDV
ncbi:XK-related protein 6-like [Branchiostoma floridae]|uniref:XK-related protein n=1 Tax=Branchiostoma floridae TaxID=7739 RepID=A0A9J7LEW4_BRAFL|nr:XK-related protein 6-like [Branchiostoma floridae]